MAIGIIHMLKVINVSDRHMEIHALLDAALLCLGKQLFSASPVVQPGQDICLHQTAERFLHAYRMASHFPQLISPSQHRRIQPCMQVTSRYLL